MTGAVTVERRVTRRVSASAAALLAASMSALIQLGPVLGQGYVLTHDMVFVPRPALGAGTLGTDRLARGVPSDLLAGLASHVLPGFVVQDLVLFAIIAVGGWGAGRLLPPSEPVPAAVAAVFYSWNPYVLEHLRMGQWAILIGYAALPWVVATMVRLRAGDNAATAAVIVSVALAGAGGAPAELLALLVAVPLALWPGGAGRRRQLAAVGIGGAIGSLPWLLPSLLLPGSVPADHVGAALFAARPDTRFGSVGSLLTLGGFWDPEVVPPARNSYVVGLAALVVSALAVWAWWRSRRRLAATSAAPVAVSAALGLLVALWGVTPGARRLLADLVASGPAAGLLRDGQRWVAPLALVLAVGLGLLASDLIGRHRARTAAALLVAPLALLPAAAWASGGSLRAVDWPHEWRPAANAVAGLPRGPVLLLPWSSQRVFTWNGRRTVAEPARLWTSRRLVGNDALQVGDRSTPVEDPVARRINALALSTAPLARTLETQGYAGVLLEADQPGAGSDRQRLAGLRRVWSDSTLELYEVHATAPAHIDRAPMAPILTVDCLAAAGLLAAIASVARKSCRNRSQRVTSAVVGPPSPTTSGDRR